MDEAAKHLQLVLQLVLGSVGNCAETADAMSGAIADVAGELRVLAVPTAATAIPVKR